MSIQAFLPVLFLAVSLTSVNPCFAQPPQPKPVPPAAVTEEFYRWYLRALLTNRDPIKNETVILKKYVAAPLLADVNRRLKAGELDADYFLQAQDFLDEWQNNMTVAQIDNKGT